MHMRGQDSRRFVVRLRHDGGYRFTNQASEDARLHGVPFVSDEPDPVGEACGPSTPALLASAVAHCLSASLLETLRHAHIPVEDCVTEAIAVVAPNDAGYPRIDHIEVTISPRLPEGSTRLARCAEVFERACTVTSSVRQGIDVRVRVAWQTPEGGMP